jgi:hypothetical protein
MARAYYQCAKCAADVEVRANSRKEADRHAQWRTKQGAVCSTCFAVQRAAEVEAENLSAAERAAASSLPALTGSEKQIPWATTLRDKMLAQFERAENLARDAVQDAAAAPELLDAAQRVLIAGEILRAKTSAHWWIDQRTTDSRTLVAVALKAEISVELQRRITAAQTPAEVEAEADALADALLIPSCSPVSQHVAEVTLRGMDLVVRVDAYVPALRSAVVGGHLAWDETARHWCRTLSSTTSGDPIDCAAELAHRLLAAGFLVRLHDPEARCRAVAGTFVRWVTRGSATGKYAGWYAIRWRKPDDLYDDARRIGGSRYKDGTVYAPPGSTDEVLDFAERHGFRVSHGALSAAEQHRAALVSGVVVLAKGRLDVSIRVAQADGVPPVLVVPDSAAIDTDLLDAD